MKNKRVKYWKFVGSIRLGLYFIHTHTHTHTPGKVSSNEKGRERVARKMGQAIKFQIKLGLTMRLLCALKYTVDVIV
jgi:hypothetical protein